MSVHEYCPGRWLAVLGESAVAVLHPDVGVPVVRELWQLTRTGSRLGAWAELLAGRGLRTVPAFAMAEAHPDGVRVLVRGDVRVRVGERTVSGAGYATWREEILPGEAGFRIDVTAGAGTDELAVWLPAADGVVAASAVRSAGGDQHAGLSLDAGDPEDISLTLQRLPALAAALPTQAAAAPAPPLEATRPPEPDSAPSLIDSVPGFGAAPPTGSAAGGWAGGDADHDGLTILPEERHAVQGETARPETDVAAQPPPPAPPALALVLPSGQRIAVDRPVLLGRAPEAGRFVGDAPRLVAVANPERDVSATHVEIRPGDGHVVVTDMSSTNGTVVTAPGDRPAFRLRPGSGVPVPPGTVIELGTGVSLRVEAQP